MDKIWLYEILGESWEVVIADTREAAEEKVRAAYRKHDSGFCEDTPIIIRSKEEEQCWFEDSPDVLEVYGG